jgi:murein DD-endopeptidase MepM/ murein hydrolase activator NlpD
MKKFYYFSKSKLKFVEIRDFYRNFIFLIFFCSLIISFFIFGAYFITKEFLNPDAEVRALEAENRELKLHINEFVGKFKEFETELDQLSGTSNNLRLSANLEPLTEEERNVGIGGRKFNRTSFSNSDDVRKILNSLSNYIDDLEVKISMEKNNYNEIETKFEENSRLYDALPAIKPSEGRYGDRFGMRFHPILKIRRMHHGVDIISNTGTPVYAPGEGVVKSIGNKGGYGKTIVIDHGFGYETLYSHLSKYIIKKGQRVKRGDLIALSGRSGKLATGPHLHYEVKHNGISLNPRNFIFDDVKIFEVNPDVQKNQE